jgi:hypothetical protein
VLGQLLASGDHVGMARHCSGVDSGVVDVAVAAAESSWPSASALAVEDAAACDFDVTASHLPAAAGGGGGGEGIRSSGAVRDMPAVVHSVVAALLQPLVAAADGSCSALAAAHQELVRAVVAEPPSGLLPTSAAGTSHVSRVRHCD